MFNDRLMNPLSHALSDDVERYWNRAHARDEQPVHRPQPELAELEAALADASAGRPSLAFIAGESGVGKTRLLQELERGALAAEARVVSGDCVEPRRGRAPLRPASSPRCDPSRATATLCSTSSARPRGPGSPASSPSSARHGAAGHGPRRAGAGARLRGAADAARPPRPRTSRSCWRSRTCTGPTPRRAPSSPSSRAACAPSACCSSPPTAPTSCTAATRCARCWPSSSAGRARGASSSCRSRAPSSPSSSRTSSAPPPDDGARRRACTRAARATRSSPRSCWPPASTAAGELPPTLRDALMVRIEALPQDAQEVLRVISAGRSLDHALLAEASGLESGRAARGPARGGGRPRDHGRRRGQLRLPPRAAARGRPRRPAARRAHRAAPGAGARVRAPHAGTGRQRAAGGGDRPPLPLGRRPARGASPPPCARPTRPTRSTPTARRRRLYERALQLWSRVPDPEALAGIDHVTLLCRGAPTRTTTSPAPRRSTRRR